MDVVMSFHVVSFTCAGAAGPGAGDLRGAEQRGQPDPQDHDAHPVPAAVPAMPGAAGRRQPQGQSGVSQGAVSSPSPCGSPVGHTLSPVFNQVPSK